MSFASTLIPRTRVQRGMLLQARQACDKGAVATSIQCTVTSSQKQRNNGSGFTRHHGVLGSMAALSPSSLALTQCRPA
jgi:hypothetical protein